MSRSTTFGFCLATSSAFAYILFQVVEFAACVEFPRSRTAQLGVPFASDSRMLRGAFWLRPAEQAMERCLFRRFSDLRELDCPPVGRWLAKDPWSVVISSHTLSDRMEPGHQAIAGSRMPPSQVDPLPPRKGVFTQPDAPPLSEVKMTSVSVVEIEFSQCVQDLTYRPVDFFDLGTGPLGGQVSAMVADQAIVV